MCASLRATCRHAGTFREFSYRVGTSTRRLAIMFAVQACASQNGVPPMRTQLRTIAEHATATLDVVTVKL